ncbi:hypothetical protein [Leekyejoonella antrihumi]|uniref:YfhO family protein n=1 Tax=Leekyejoonella antrihumi TaxID=1660198 RepID=A0A563E4A0_9MICO|nr:hypothetical protein [Leekyejoonella antrihumi]TWP37129.1 hypothetical protein FGL98_06835 [Leekyejoonella antrihumi]
MTSRSLRLSPRSVGGLVGLGCAVLALGPALRPGYLLFYDMVFVPHLALGGRTLGVDGSVPRAVPNDLVVALLSHLASGWVVQKVLLVAVFVLVGAGVGGLMRSRWGAAAAAIVAAWNPYLGERLGIGHWAFLLGYAVLPFLASAAGACREGLPRGRFRLGLWLVLVALTGSTGAVLGLLVVLCVLLVPGQSVRATRDRVLDLVWTIGIFLLANAPWWFPFLFVAPSESGDPLGVQAFMSRADTPWGVVLSLVTTGGIWNQDVWFAERSSWVVSGVALAAALGSVLVAARTTSWRRVPATAGLAVAGVLSLVVAAASSLPGGSDLMTWVVTDVPGGGLLRDSQKFVGVWALVLAVATGLTVERLRAAGARVGADRAGVGVLAVVIMLWPVATLSGMIWGAQGRWRAVEYPQSYQRLADDISALPPGGVAAFPWTQYRQYAWDGNWVVLDPWQRLVQRSVLVNDDLPLAHEVVQGESLAARAVTTALADKRGVTQALHRAGVRYVLVETDQPTRPGMPDLSGARLVDRATGLALYDIGAPSHPVAGPSGWYRYLGLVGGILALLVVAATRVAGGAGRGRAPRRKGSRAG